jgi:uncharacterized membrane protein
MTAPVRKPLPSMLHTLLEVVIAVLIVEGVVIGAMWLAGGRKTLTTFLSWPDGSLWSNEIATATLLVGAGFGILRKLEAHHRQKMEQAQDHHDEIMSHLRRLTPGSGETAAVT